MARRALLNEMQLAVLKWVGDGCPEGIYEDGFEHRVSARALERRDLVSVRGHGPSWRATLTDDGRYYLDHGAYPPSDEPRPLRPRRVRAPSRPAPVPIDDLLGRLEASGGWLRVDTPTAVDRISYRRAVEQARSADEIPPDRRLRITGTKRGPLLVELIQVAASEEPRERIPVPFEADLGRAEIRVLSASAALLPVGGETRPRALALVQAIIDECKRRGWTFTVDEEPSFLITVGEDGYRCLLSEEREMRDVFADEDVDARKYVWQRVSPTRREVWAGRLKLEFGPRYKPHRWADRKRWTLASRLPDVFRTIEELSKAEQARRDRLNEHHAQQVRDWEKAVLRARDLYLHALNADRAQQQVNSWSGAERLRSYAEAVRRRAEELDVDARAAASAWAAWLAEEADHVDPLRLASELRVSSPTEMGAAELDPHMPNRWTVRQPPNPPTWLP